MPKTDYFDQKIEDAFWQGASLGAPATLYFSFSTTAPTQVSTSFWNFTEPTTAGSYSRLSMTANATNFGPGSLTEPPTGGGYEIENLVALTFTTSSAAWSTGSTPLVAVGVFDSATIGAGNLWVYSSDSPTVTVNASGVIVSFPIGTFLDTNN